MTFRAVVRRPGSRKPEEGISQTFYPTLRDAERMWKKLLEKQPEKSVLEVYQTQEIHVATFGPLTEGK